jgi:hypothetical protein
MYIETKIPDTMYNEDVVDVQQGMGRECECWNASCCVVERCMHSGIWLLFRSYPPVLAAMHIHDVLG